MLSHNQRMCASETSSPKLQNGVPTTYARLIVQKLWRFQKLFSPQNSLNFATFQGEMTEKCKPWAKKSRINFFGPPQVLNHESWVNGSPSHRKHAFSAFRSGVVCVVTTPHAVSAGTFAWNFEILQNVGGDNTPAANILQNLEVSGKCASRNCVWCCDHTNYL